MLILITSQLGSMLGGDHCAAWGCDNDRRYPEKLKILPHVGMFRFYSPKNKQDVLSWSKAIKAINLRLRCVPGSAPIILHKDIGTSNLTHLLCILKVMTVRIDFKDPLLRSEARKCQRKRPEKESKVEMIS